MSCWLYCWGVLTLDVSRFLVWQVIVLRHSLFALRSHDVMAADFDHVAWVTFALLALVVVSMVGLNLVGIAQV